MLTLIRDIRTDTTILGCLYHNGGFICYTLENNAKAIPCGLYTLDNSKSPKFGRELPLVYNATTVKASRGIRIHRGNTYRDSEGCILVGMGRSSEKSSVTESANAEMMVTMLCRTDCQLVVCEEGA